MSNKKIIEVEKLVSCLPGYENVNGGSMIKKLSRKFYHKSGTELRFELEQKQKLLTWTSNDVENFNLSMS